MHSNIATGHSIDPISVRLAVSVLYRVHPKREIEPAIAPSIAVAATRIISLRSKAFPDSVNWTNTASALVAMSPTCGELLLHEQLRIDRAW
jgi:hypothetical protein